jgi:hypothetical protein
VREIVKQLATSAGPENDKFTSLSLAISGAEKPPKPKQGNYSLGPIITDREPIVKRFGPPPKTKMTLCLIHF